MQNTSKPFDQVLPELRSFGFRVNEKFLVDTFGKDSTCSFNNAYEELLNTDFRKSVYLDPSFGTTINTVETDSLEGPVVLQISSITNVSQPTARGRQHEDSTPRLLVIKLSDGHMTAGAVEYERIPGLSTQIAPGSKILLNKTVKVLCGKIFLSSKSCQVLGGRVDHLFKAWLTNKNTLSNRQHKTPENSTEGESPPAFLQILSRNDENLARKSATPSVCSGTNDIASSRVPQCESVDDNPSISSSSSSSQPSSKHKKQIKLPAQKEARCQSKQNPPSHHNTPPSLPTAHPHRQLPPSPPPPQQQQQQPQKKKHSIPGCSPRPPHDTSASASPCAGRGGGKASRGRGAGRGAHKPSHSKSQDQDQHQNQHQPYPAHLQGSSFLQQQQQQQQQQMKAGRQQRPSGDPPLSAPMSKMHVAPSSVTLAPALPHPQSTLTSSSPVFTPSSSSAMGGVANTSVVLSNASKTTTKSKKKYTFT